MAGSDWLWAQVGKYFDGAPVPRGRADHTGAQVIQDAGPRYQEAAKRGNLYIVNNTASTPGTSLGTTAPLAVSCRVAGKQLVVYEVGATYVSGTLGSGVLYLCQNAQVAALGGSVLTPVNAKLGSNNSSAATAASGASLAATPTVVKPVMSLGPVLATTAIMYPPQPLIIDGGIIVPYQMALSLEAVAGAGTSPVMAMWMVFEEMDAPYLGRLFVPLLLKWQLNLSSGSGSQTVVITAGIASSAGLGTPSVSATAAILVSGIASSLSLGGPAVTTIARILPGGIASSAAYGTCTVTPGAVSVAPSGIASSAGYGSHTLTSLATISPSGRSSSLAYGSHTVSCLAHVAPSGIASGAAYGSHTLTPGGVSILPGGIASSGAYGSHVVGCHAYVLPGSCTSSVALGSPVVSCVAHIAPSGRATSLAYGSHTVSPGPVTIAITAGVASSALYGSHTVTAAAAGSQTVLPSSIGSSTAFGSHTLQAFATIRPGSIGSGVSLGAHTVSPGAVTIAVSSGVASHVALGTHVVRSVAYILPSGLATSSGLGLHTVSPGPVYVAPGGRASTAATGSPTVRSVYGLYPGGIPSSGTTGSPVLSATATVRLTSIFSSAAPGSPVVGAGGVFISTTGIASSADVGVPFLQNINNLLFSGIASSAGLGSHTVGSRLPQPAVLFLHASGVALPGVRLFIDASSLPSVTLCATLATQPCVTVKATSDAQPATRVTAHQDEQPATRLYTERKLLMSDTRLTWVPDPSVAVTSFTVQKSTDEGITFSTIATVTAGAASPNYDRQDKVYFYVDSGSSPGDVYKVTCTGPNGTSLPAYAVAAPDPLPLCLVIGYVANGFGDRLSGVAVSVKSFGAKSSAWVNNPAGTIAQNPRAVGVAATSEKTVYTDAAGIWQVSLVQKTEALVTIPDLRFEYAFEVPAKTGPINIRDIAELRGGSFHALHGEPLGVPTFPRLLLDSSSGVCFPCWMAHVVIGSTVRIPREHVLYEQVVQDFTINNLGAQTAADLGFAARAPQQVTLWEEDEHAVYLPRGADWQRYTFGAYGITHERPEALDEEVPWPTPIASLRSYQEPALAALNETPGDKILVLGCVAGSTEISLNRGGKGFTTTIANAYRALRHENKGKKWDLSIPTYARSHVGDRIGLHKIEDIYYSGVKDVVLLSLEDGKTLRLTSDHRVLTTHGWVEAGKLTSADEVITDGKREASILKPKLSYRRLSWYSSHPYARVQAGPTGRPKYQIELHRAVAEAHLNNLTLAEYRARCKEGDTCGLVFINPTLYHVHHVDGDIYNNRPENLQVLAKEDHLAEHQPGFQAFGSGVPTPVAVRSVRPDGAVETYDIACDDPHHNFVANGVVVHNCGKGKTFLSLMYAAQKNRRTLVIVDTDELLEQWLERITDDTPGRTLFGGWDEDVYGPIGLIKGKSGQIGWTLTLATIQTLARRYKQGHLDHEFFEAFGLVIVDETHIMGAPSFLAVLPGLYGERLGLSATPARKDGLDLAYRLHMGSREGFCYVDIERDSEVRWVFKRLPNLLTEYELSTCYRRTRGGGRSRFYNRGDRDSGSQLIFMAGKYHTKAGEKEAWNDIIVHDLSRAYAAGRNVLVLGETKAQLTIIQEKCKELGLDCGVATSAVSKKSRRAAKQCRILLATQQLAGKGLDIGRLDTLFILVPYNDVDRLRQAMGRVDNRTGEEKAETLVVTYVHQVPTLLRKQQGMLQDIRTIMGSRTRISMVG